MTDQDGEISHKTKPEPEKIKNLALIDNIFKSCLPLPNMQDDQNMHRGVNPPSNLPQLDPIVPDSSNIFQNSQSSSLNSFDSSNLQSSNLQSSNLQSSNSQSQN